MHDYSSLSFFILIILVISVSLWLGWRSNHVWKEFQLWRNIRRGKLGETKAKKILQLHGFKVVDQQLTIEGHFFVDEVPVDFLFRPDFLVERDGIQYLAEVKMGKVASENDRNTRRQLLEYAYFTKSSAILLIDSSKEKIKIVHFQELLFD